MGLIIATFGEHPAGIIESIKQFGCEKLILLIPEPLSQKGKEGLEKVMNITRELNIETEKIKLNPYDFMGNIKEIKSIIKKEKNEIILNVTGGRKTLSMAATLAGFVTKPNKIIYIQEEDNKPLEIPRFTIYDKLLSREKKIILSKINDKTSLEEILLKLKKNGGISPKEPAVRKHLRELLEMDLINIDKDSRPFTYTINVNGKLLR